MRHPHLALLLALLAGCGGSSTGPGDDASPRWANLGRACPSDAPATSLGAAERAALPAPTPPFTVDERWAELARTVPGGWGGYFHEPSSRRDVIWLVDPSRRDEAVSALITAGVPVSPNAVARQARWDFGQLYDWYTHLRTVVWSVEGVSSSHIDESENRLGYGAVDEAARRRLEAALAAAEVPCFLVAIEIQPYATTAHRAAPLHAALPGPPY